MWQQSNQHTFVVRGLVFGGEQLLSVFLPGQQLSLVSRHHAVQLTVPVSQLRDEQLQLLTLLLYDTHLTLTQSGIPHLKSDTNVEVLNVWEVDFYCKNISFRSKANTATTSLLEKNNQSPIIIKIQDGNRRIPQFDDRQEQCLHMTYPA